jgi:hypothetical protein
MQQEPKHTVFFSSKSRKLSAFAREVVDIKASTIKGIKVAFTHLQVETPVPGRQFWVVKVIPAELRRQIVKDTDYVVQGDSTYRIGQPLDDESLLLLLREAEVEARKILFPERYISALATSVDSYG